MAADSSAVPMPIHFRLLSVMAPCCCVRDARPGWAWVASRDAPCCPPACTAGPPGLGTSLACGSCLPFVALACLRGFPFCAVTCPSVPRSAYTLLHLQECVIGAGNCIRWSCLVH